jgi:hypothetical protein
LERSLARLEWTRVREREANEAAAQQDAERDAMLSIDWHDFVVVETIEFYDDEEAELPPPMTLKEARATAAPAASGARLAGSAACVGAVWVGSGVPRGLCTQADMAVRAHPAQVLQAARAGQYEEQAAPSAAAAAAAAAQAGVVMDEAEKAMLEQAAAASVPPLVSSGPGRGGYRPGCHQPAELSRCRCWRRLLRRRRRGRRRLLTMTWTWKRARRTSHRRSGS